MAGMLLIGLNLDWDQSKLRQKRQAFLVNFKRHLSGRRATCTHCVYVADQHPPPPPPGGLWACRITWQRHSLAGNRLKQGSHTTAVTCTITCTCVCVIAKGTFVYMYNVQYVHTYM